MGGAGAPSEARLSPDLARSAAFLLSLNPRSWPTVSSEILPLSKASQTSFSLRALHALTFEHFLSPRPYNQPGEGTEAEK